MVLENAQQDITALTKITQEFLVPLAIIVLAEVILSQLNVLKVHSICTSANLTAQTVRLVESAQ